MTRTALAQYVPSGPDQAEDTVHTLLLAACYQAKHRLIAVTPYFVPDDALLEALRMAALRGVQVTLVVPRRSNHRTHGFRPRSRVARAGLGWCRGSHGADHGSREGARRG